MESLNGERALSVEERPFRAVKRILTTSLPRTAGPWVPDARFVWRGGRSARREAERSAQNHAAAAALFLPYLASRRSQKLRAKTKILIANKAQGPDGMCIKRIRWVERGGRQGDHVKFFVKFTLVFTRNTCYKRNCTGLDRCLSIVNRL